MEHLQWPAAIVALLGAWLVGAHRARDRRIGFACFLAANVLWCGVAITAGMWALLVMQAAFCVTSIRGIITNRPARPQE